MIEFIGIVACVIACIGIPFQTSKVRAGYMPPNYKGTAADYRAAYLKQVAMLMWVGLVFGVLLLGMVFLPVDKPYEWIAKAVSAALWFTMSALGFFSRRALRSAAPVPAAP
ncbi:MAG TPA: hypothetical protein VG387_05790 [Rhizomicrobium sp.]|nr:hypothetical protein [Rhizomicrobium sp.]